MLSLTAKTIHLDGQHSDVTGQFGIEGGSLGRDAKCDLVLPDPDRRISRLQARIVYTGKQYAVRNSSTSNPMYVNGVELAPGSSQAISSGDELRAGSYVITVTELKDAAQAPDDQPAAQASPGTPQAADVPVQPEPLDLGGQVDPLLALGSDGQSNATGVDPFADLVPAAAPMRGHGTGVETRRKNESLHSPSTAGLPPVESVEPKSAIGNRAPESEAPVPNEPSAAERQQVEAPANITQISSTETAQVALEIDPLGDIVGQALPIEVADATSLDPGVNAPLPSGHDIEPDKKGQGNLSGLEQARSGAPDSRIAREQEIPILNPWDTPRQRTGNAQNPSPETWAPSLSALAGDPFADLMGPAVESHMARAPVSASVLPEGAYIPDDFNPFALDGVAQRNSSDPLTPLGHNARGLADVMPEHTIDSIYAPGAESPSALVIDPIEESGASALHVEQSVDPMKLFSGDGQGMDALLGGNRAGHDKSVPDHTLEMAAFFRAPTARPDTVTHEPLVEAVEIGGGVSRVPPSLPADALQQAAQTASPTDPAALPPAVEIASLEPSGDVLPGSSVSPPDPLPNPAPPCAEPGLGDSVDTAIQASGIPLLSTNTPQPVAKTLADDANPETANTQNLMSAFKRGAGLQDWPEQSITPELMETVGRMLQAAAQGMVSLLASRATVKQEIHLSVTLINPKSNNPLKFLPDGHTALLQMLGPRIPGFMAPVEAVEEAFKDLIIHQTAIAAGTQAAIEGLFQRFNPLSIEAQNSQNGVSEKMSNTLYQARLWRFYKTQYKMIHDEIRDDFFERLGSDFHEAYNMEYGNSTPSKR